MFFGSPALLASFYLSDLVYLAPGATDGYDLDRLQAALNWANGVMAPYLVAYDFSVGDVSTLDTCAADLARYQLDNIDPRTDVKQRFDYWINWLAGVQSGDTVLPFPRVPSAAGSSAIASIEAIVVDPDPVDFGGFINVSIY